MLSERLEGLTPNKANKGCNTCKWILTLNEKDKQSFDNWIAEGHSLHQLYAVCASDPENPLPISLSAFKNHFRDCKK